MTATGAAAEAVACRAIARVAVVNLDRDTCELLRDSFLPFGIETVALSGAAVRRLQKEKFEGCVLRLDRKAAAVLESARSSRGNRRMVIYAVGNARQALEFSRYGINSILSEPLDRQAVLRAVRATQLLVIRELRRYVRIPIVTEVQVEFGGGRLAAASQEISAGGMSLSVANRLPSAEKLQLTFALPGGARIAVRASVCWQRDAEQLVGVRFDPADDRRLTIRQWVDDYLHIA